MEIAAHAGDGFLDVADERRQFKGERGAGHAGEKDLRRWNFQYAVVAFGGGEEHLANLFGMCGAGDGDGDHDAAGAVVVGPDFLRRGDECSNLE